MMLFFILLGIFSSAVCVNEASSVSVFLLSSRLRRGQMKEASEMKYGDQVEGVCAHKAVCVFMWTLVIYILLKSKTNCY